MDEQPLLPERQVPKTLEYSPAGPDHPAWLVSDWPGVASAFGLESFEIDTWHACLAGQGRPWMVVRRVFGVAPLWGEGVTPDDMRSWAWKDLSHALGVAEAALKKDLDDAVEFWKKCKVAASIGRAVQSQSSAGDLPMTDLPVMPKPHEDDGLPDFQIHRDLAPEKIDAILTPFRFHTIKSAADRLYVANRILELRKLLEDKYKRESVRQLIVMEVSMANYEATIHSLKSRLETIQRSNEISEKQSAEIQKISEALTTAETALTKLSTTYQKQADEIGGDEMEAGEARRVAIGTISHLAEAHRKYYESGDRTLIDGMFSADEVVWLTQPLSIRPAQYRPDVVLRMREAMIPENLWDKDYKPTVIQREACRRMLKLVQAMAEETDAPPIEGIDDVRADTFQPEEADDAAAIYDDVQSSQQQDPLPAVMSVEKPRQRAESCIVIG